MEFEEILAYLISTPGAGAIAYFIIKYVPWFWQFADDKLRYIACSLTAIISMAAFTTAVLTGFVPMPTDVYAWIGQLVGLALAAFGVSQIAHAHELRKDPQSS